MEVYMQNCLVSKPDNSVSFKPLGCSALLIVKSHVAGDFTQ
jgi:hypothetical protein